MFIFFIFESKKFYPFSYLSYLSYLTCKIDYFTVACRTGEAGMGGVSLILVERTMPGVTTRQMKCSGVWSSGTTYITFEDVVVPKENLIGEENKGFKYIMYNFKYVMLFFITSFFFSSFFSFPIFHKFFC